MTVTVFVGQRRLSIECDCACFGGRMLQMRVAKLVGFKAYILFFAGWELWATL